MLRAFSAWVASSWAAARSSASSPSPRIAYPPDSLARIPGSRILRSREAYVRTAASAWEGGSSPHRASISSAAVAVRPSRSNRAASRARCWGDPVFSNSSPRRARTGPSTLKRNDGTGAVAGFACCPASVGGLVRRPAPSTECVSCPASVEESVSFLAPATGFGCCRAPAAGLVCGPVLAAGLAFCPVPAEGPVSSPPPAAGPMCCLALAPGFAFCPVPAEEPAPSPPPATGPMRCPTPATGPAFSPAPATEPTSSPPPAEEPGRLCSGTRGAPSIAVPLGPVCNPVSLPCPWRMRQLWRG